MSRGQTWGEDEVLSLIEIFWGENIQSMVDNTSRNRDVYKIVTDLMERKGHCRNAYEIRTKVNNLKQWYKRIKTGSSNQRNERHKRTRIYQSLEERLVDEGESRDNEEDDQEEMEETEEGERSNDGSTDFPSNTDTDQHTASPSSARQETRDNSETSTSAVDLSQASGSESRKRKRTTPDRLIIDSSVDDGLHKDDNLGSNSSGSDPTDDPESYPKGVVVVQPTAVEDELDLTPATREEPVVSRNEPAPASNQRVLFAINRNPKKTPVPILPKITAVHSGFIQTVNIANVSRANVSQPRHSATPYDRPQNRQRATRAPAPVPPPPPPPPPQSTGFDPNVLLEQQQQEEHEAKMELYRLQIELANAQLRMAEDEHRIRLAKLQVELQTAQMEHDAKAAELSTAS